MKSIPKKLTKHFHRCAARYIGLLVLIVIVGFIAEYNWDFINSSDNGVLMLHYILMVILSLLLVATAYIQIKKLNTITKADFLLRVDDRYGSPNIVKARTIIHKIYVTTNSENLCRDKHILKIAEEVKQLGISKNTSDIENFVLLLNFLDFLETIAFLAEENHINYEEISALSGDSIIFYYRIFKPWIDCHRHKHNRYTYYEYLDTFYKKYHKPNDRGNLS